MAPTGMFRTLWPLPGGVGNYLKTLEWIVKQVAEVGRTDAVAGLLVERFGVSNRKTAMSYLRVAHTLGLIEISGPSTYLTPEGEAYAVTPSPTLVAKVLNSRIVGCADITAELARRPRRIGPLTQLMRERGHTWSTNTQVRYRLRWLEEVGEVQRQGTVRPEYHTVV